MDGLGAPRSEPAGSCGPQGMGLDGEGVQLSGVTLLADTEGTKGVDFILHKAKEGQPGCTALFQRRAVLRVCHFPILGNAGSGAQK